MDPRPPSLFDPADDIGALPDSPAAAPGGGAGPGATVRARPEDRSVEVPRPPTLLAVDGDSLAHRAFHGYPSDRTPGPVYGFLALLVAVCDQVALDALVVGFDSRVSSRRRQSHASYKGQRDEKDPGLLAVLLALPEGLADIGINVVTPQGWEADDAVASAAATAEAAGWRCAVATSDRDAYCLVSERTTVLRLRGGGEITRVTPQRLQRELGVRPGQYVEYAALRGDVSDNLPGVPGIGPARAAALLALYETVEDAGADPIGCRSVLGRDVGQALLDDLAAEESVFRRNRDLMTPRRDLGIDLRAASHRPRPEHVAERLEAWGLGALAGRAAGAFGARPDPVPLPESPPS